MCPYVCLCVSHPTLPLGTLSPGFCGVPFARLPAQGMPSSQPAEDQEQLAPLPKLPLTGLPGAPAVQVRGNAGLACVGEDVHQKHRHRCKWEKAQQRRYASPLLILASEHLHRAFLCCLPQWAAAATLAGEGVVKVCAILVFGARGSSAGGQRCEPAGKQFSIPCIVHLMAWQQQGWTALQLHALLF